MQRSLFLSLLMVVGLQAETSFSKYSIKLHQGQKSVEMASFMVDQIIAEFGKYPYLFRLEEGGYLEGIKDCENFMNGEDASIAIVYHEMEPVGFISGSPCSSMKDAPYDQVKNLFAGNGIDFKECYYIAEIIIKPEYHRKGLASKLHALIEEHVRGLNYRVICLAEESHDVHPLRPIGYNEAPKKFFARKGYEKTDMVLKSSWNTLQIDGSVKEQEHLLTYWVKKLN